MFALWDSAVSGSRSHVASSARVADSLRSMSALTTDEFGSKSHPSLDARRIECPTYRVNLISALFSL